MLTMNSCSLQNPTFNGVLADNIMKKHPEKVIKKLELSAEEKSFDMLRGAKMGNLITKGLISIKEADQYLTEQLFAGRVDYIEGVNKTLSKSLVEKLYAVK